MNYNGTQYSYLYNLQGDVIGLVDSAGALVVEYKYNAWGSITGRAGSLAGTLGKLNPFRYRGYVYDEETWMYYCGARYYYPELQRWICADDGFDEGAGFAGCNLFTYCANRPVSFYDPSGDFLYQYSLSVRLREQLLVERLAVSLVTIMLTQRNILAGIR